MMGDVHKSQCIISKGAEARECEMDKGRRVCFPSWQASHKDGETARLLQLDRKSKGKCDKAEALG